MHDTLPRTIDTRRKFAVAIIDTDRPLGSLGSLSVELFAQTAAHAPNHKRAGREREQRDRQDKAQHANDESRAGTRACNDLSSDPRDKADRYQDSDQFNELERLALCRIKGGAPFARRKLLELRTENEPPRSQILCRRCHGSSQITEWI